MLCCIIDTRWRVCVVLTRMILFTLYPGIIREIVHEIYNQHFFFIFKYYYNLSCHLNIIAAIFAMPRVTVSHIEMPCVTISHIAMQWVTISVSVRMWCCTQQVTSKASLNTILHRVSTCHGVIYPQDIDPTGYGTPSLYIYIFIHICIYGRGLSRPRQVI